MDGLPTKAAPGLKEEPCVVLPLGAGVLSGTSLVLGACVLSERVTKTQWCQHSHHCMCTENTCISDFIFPMNNLLKTIPQGEEKPTKIF